ncbi:MAG: (2Fe-2S)-binding protein [Candidatus Schekmanbacteria bacterium]|nr:(2Fe-2S)-binding protein [Candidatus Schekmanbacteria bacterium]
MPKCIIDGREVEFTPGQNLIEVAKSAGIVIPGFCYHPGLSVVAQCRMCAVEIEKMPKLQTACSTAATEGMVVKTRSERVKDAQKSVMEFLLINHPLDCPICDKAGECDLQDRSFDYGSPYQRYAEERRTFEDVDMGPVIKKNMNRCIHCTRCIRFGDEIAGIREMVAIHRGNSTEITTLTGLPLETEYAGNYADICPTGSLTLKDFRFKKRVWFLKKVPTICEGCSRGCSLELHQSDNVIYRCVARENLEVNKYWICDEGRFNFHYVQAPERLTEPAARQGGSLQSAEWSVAVAKAKATIVDKKVTVLVGSDLTQEEALLLKELAPKHFPGAAMFHFGTPGITAGQHDAPADKILKRTSKTSNLHGLEQLGFEGLVTLPRGTEAVVVFRGGRATLPDLGGLATVGVGVFTAAEAEAFQAVLPGLTFTEKSGTIVNFEGREQQLKRVILPLGQAKPLAEILTMWANVGAAAVVARAGAKV